MTSFFKKMDELNSTANKYNIFSAPISDREAIHFLSDYLLKDGEIYTAVPLTHEQMNTEVVFTILKKYSSKFRKELRKWEKKNK